MGKSLFIAEKPSVAQEFARALDQPMSRHDGYQEGDNAVVTWCVGHLVTMSYPEVYDPKYKRWRLDTLPFIPDQFLYEVIPGVKKQFGIVRTLLNRKDIDTIYVCTDSGREGEYIYRLVAQEADVKNKQQKRVWIDSQTKEEILRGIREAKDLSAYDNLASAAYLRAKEDYLMGINFSRLLTLKYGDSVAAYLGQRYCVISVGRVMTCVLGMIVRREREIRSFVKTPFYRVIVQIAVDAEGSQVSGEFRAVEGSRYFQSPKLYKENGFKEKKDAQEMIASFGRERPLGGLLEKVERKKEKKNPPLLYNLAELQNDCSKVFHISPDQTLAIAQELYEKKLTTYPRTDARVLSTAVAKQIDRNISGLQSFAPAAEYAGHILASGTHQNIARTKYTNDKQITDHYALIPTGQGLGALKSLSSTAYGVYCMIVRRFLRIFYPPAEYTKVSLVTILDSERFFSSVRALTKEGYLAVMPPKKSAEQAQAKSETDSGKEDDGETVSSPELVEKLGRLKKGMPVQTTDLTIREGMTSPPKRYNSGSMILAMETAGQLIEDEELRAQIKGSGIGTSATRAEILKKLVANKYIALNKKTQILTPTLLGEMIFDVVNSSIRPLLNPDLTASWEKGLTYVANGEITSDEYMDKLRGFIVRRTEAVRGLNNQTAMRSCYDAASHFYAKAKSKTYTRKKKTT